MNLPRQKALLHMLLDCASNLLAKNGTLWLAGENKAGIKSAEKSLRLYFQQVKKLDNARHCTLYQASNTTRQGPFDPKSHQDLWSVNCKQTQLSVSSYPGVFAHGRLDAGTSLLLEALADIEVTGNVLDFGCGAGVVGACMIADQQVRSLTLLDNNALALRACKETLAANQLKGSILASDGLSMLKDDFDLIVSNPPIHAGVKTDNLLGMRLLESVHEHIRPGGMLVLVANVHLPYEKWLSQRFKFFEERLANDGYKVITAKN